MESTERIHPPTPHRRELARQQGRRAKSQDLPLAGVFLAGVLLLMVGGGSLFDSLADSMRQHLGAAPMLLADATPVAADSQAVWRLARSLGVLCGGLLGVAVLGHVLQTGFQPQPQRLAPDLSRLDPVTSAARIFSGGMAGRQVMLLLKLILVSGAAVWAVADQCERIFALGHLAPTALAAGVAEILGGICLKIGAALFVAALADYGYQRWRLERSLQMTADELREELRNQNGDPAVHQRRRQVQRDLALGSLASAVTRSRLVLADGRSLAVALQYDGRPTSVPVVAAKGRGDSAGKIRETAERVKIRIVEDPRLAQAIARQTSIGVPIAAEHYRCVANLFLVGTSR